MGDEVMKKVSRILQCSMLYHPKILLGYQPLYQRNIWIGKPSITNRFDYANTLLLKYLIMLTLFYWNIWLC